WYRFARFGGEDGRDAEQVISATQGFGDASVVSVNGVPKRSTVIGNYGVRQFIVVKNRAAAGRPINDVNAVCAAIVEIDSCVDFLVSAEGNGWPLPSVEPKNRPRIMGFFDLFQEMRIGGHVGGPIEGPIDYELPAHGHI